MCKNSCISGHRLSSPAHTHNDTWGQSKGWTNDANNLIYKNARAINHNL